jgi:ATP-dependent helicase/DNAse subunit B
MKGKKILKRLVEKQQEMSASLLSMMSTVLDIQSLPHHLIAFFSQSFHENVLMGKSSEEKIDILSKRVDILNLVLEILGKNKVEMENELEILMSNKTKNSTL